MKTKITLTLLFLAVFNFSFAQYGKIGHLTVFSESGDKFFLVLNGERQNEVAQTNIRVEALPQPYYTAKIIFEDKSIGELNQNYLPIIDADEVYQDVTYRIKTDKKDPKKKKLQYFSMIPIDQGYVVPANVYVVHYGQPAPPPPAVVETGGMNTNTNMNTNMNVNMNAGINMGVNVNMNVNVNESYSETTTHQQSGYVESAAVPVAAGCNEAYPMGPKDFSGAVSTVKGQGFDDTRLKIAKQIASANCLNTNQISEICKTFGFEESKLDFAKFAYDHCTEPQNYFKLNSLFSFSSNVDALTEYIEQRH